MDSKKHAKFTGDRAEISRRVGGKISAFDGYIQGTNIELVPDEKIAQKWRSSDWPEGHWSTVRFEFKRVPNGTRLVFTQTDVPEDDYEAKSEGWVEHYWDKMKKELEKG